MTESSQLLRKYAEEHDEAAFTRLVELHLDLVYSTALRQLGDADLAKDVAQVVFADLSRKAKTFSAGIILSGWLYRHTGFVSSKLRRTEQRRRAREQKMLDEHITENHAREHNSMLLVLDDAMKSLNSRERDALVLRFFEGRSLMEVGQALGMSDNAARMRVERAIEKLRLILKRRGITSSSSIIAAALASATSPAPAGLAGIMASAALANTAAASALTLTLNHVMNATQMKAGAAAVLIGAAVATPVWMHHKLEQLQREAHELRQLASNAATLQQENERLSKITVNYDELEQLRRDKPELLRLRSEVGLLRKQLQEFQSTNTDSAIPKEKPAEQAGNNSADAYLQPGFYPADAWKNIGFISPQNSSMTFLWALRNGHAKDYSESLGKTNMLQLPIEWANALEKIKGSDISETVTSDEGDTVVSVRHELEDGSTANTWLGFRQVGNQWQVKRIMGFPIVVTKTELGAAPVSQPTQ